MAEQALMAILLNRSEIPNLLELVEAYGASMLADIPICGDEAADAIPSRGPSFSLCADEASG
jgi:hypothetical protein